MKKLMLPLIIVALAVAARLATADDSLTYTVSNSSVTILPFAYSNVTSLVISTNLSWDAVGESNVTVISTLTTTNAVVTSPYIRGVNSLQIYVSGANCYFNPSGAASNLNAIVPSGTWLNYSYPTLAPVKPSFLAVSGTATVSVIRTTR